MFRGGVGKEKPQPHVRQAQIDALRKAFPAAKYSADLSLWDIPLPIPGSRDGALLRVHLSPDFPNVAPILQVVGDVVHHLLDDRGYLVGSQKLARWTPTNDVSRVVQEILDEFRRMPPRLHPRVAGQTVYASAGGLMPQQQPQPQPQPPQPTGGVVMVPSPVSQPQTLVPVQPPPHSRIQVPTSFPQLEAMSRSELEKLDADAAAYASFFESLPVVQQAKESRDRLMLENVERAKANLLHKPTIETLSAEIQQLRDHNSALRSQFDALAQRQNAILKRFEPQAVAARLHHEAERVEAESDKLSRAIENGEMSVKDLQQLVTLRSRVNSLREKQQRMTVR